MPPPLVLASGSPFRKALLANAGIVFSVTPADLDERSVEAPLTRSGAAPGDVALVLAIAKADEVSGRLSGSLVIGSDQTLSLDGEIFHKPADFEAARRHLLRLSGKTHELNSAVAIVRDGETLWSHVGVAHMTMRALSPKEIGRYLASVGDKALASVGAYQVEAFGIRLLEEIDGDYFTIVGMPMLPLLAALRHLGAIDTEPRDEELGNG